MSIVEPHIGSSILTRYATRMAERACRALKGEKGMRECSFLYMPGIEGGNEIALAVGVDYFSAPVIFAASKANML